MPIAENEGEGEEKELPGGKVAFALGGGLSNPGAGKERGEGTRVVFEDVVEGEKAKKRTKYGDGNAAVKSALEDMIKEDEKVKERHNWKDYWVCEGIVVKVMSKKLAEKGCYKKKGVVKKVIEKYLGEIEMLDTKHVLRVDQAELETVIPQIGGLVKIVNGAYRGMNARFLSINTDKYCAKVQIEKGLYDGRVLQAVDYEDICKLA
uniref:KN17 SH3-like C-terminal domain-containing protein n=1 Tax=Chenopodium quinoa TaxID=63459 RepID=A0A803KPW4_CHEQI